MSYILNTQKFGGSSSFSQRIELGEKQNRITIKRGNEVMYDGPAGCIHDDGYQTSFTDDKGEKRVYNHGNCISTI
jgi:hypothetical protein